MEVDRELRAPDRAVTGCPAYLDPEARAHGGGWPADRRWCSGHRPGRFSPEPSRCRLMTHPGRWPRHGHLYDPPREVASVSPRCRFTSVSGWRELLERRTPGISASETPVEPALEVTPQ